MQKVSQLKMTQIFRSAHRSSFPRKVKAWATWKVLVRAWAFVLASRGGFDGCDTWDSVAAAFRPTV